MLDEKDLRVCRFTAYTRETPATLRSTVEDWRFQRQEMGQLCACKRIRGIIHLRILL
jgi:hypothetical protein